MDFLTIILLAVDVKTPSAFPLPWYGRMIKAASWSGIENALTNPPLLLIVVPLFVVVQIVVLPLKLVFGGGNLLKVAEAEGRRVLESKFLNFHAEFVTPYSNNPSNPKPRFQLKSLRTTGVRRATPWRVYQAAYDELWGHFEAYCQTVEVLSDHPSSSSVTPALSPSLTVPELKALCREHGITGYSSMRKSELIELLMAHNAVDNSAAAPAQSPTLLASGFYGFRENYKRRLDRIAPGVLFPEHFQLEPLVSRKFISVMLVVAAIFGVLMLIPALFG